MPTALELYDRGVVLSNAGKHSAARRVLARALAGAGADHNLRARVMGTSAFVASEAGDPDAAAALCEEALEVQGLSAQTVAVLEGQQGLITLRRGDRQAALPLLTASIRALQDEPVLAGMVLLNRGVAYLEMGDLADADADFAAAAQRFELGERKVDAAKAGHNQGYVALLSGDLIKALTLMEGARRDGAGESPVDGAVCDVDRAEVLLALGMPTEASTALVRSAQVFGRRRMRRLQADTEWILARTLMYSDPRRAARIARQASRRYRAALNESGALRADALALRAEVSAGGVRPQLIPELTDLAAALSEHGLDEDAASCRLTIARVHARRGALDAATTSLGAVRRRGRASILGRTLSREVHAEVAAARGDDRQVLREAARGVDELREWQALFGSLDLQSSLNMHGQALTRAGVAAAVRSGRVETVFEWSERARQLASNSQAPRRSRDPETAANLAELRVLRFEGPLTGAALRHDAELRDQITRRHWTDTESGPSSAMVSLDSVRSSLGSTGSVLISYLWSGSGLTALIVSGEKSRLIDLGSPDLGQEYTSALQAELDMVAANLPGSIGAAIQGSLTARLSALARRLVEPVMADPIIAELPEARLVITVPGVLVGVPWSMLPGFAGRTITVPTSATRWTADQLAEHALSIRRAGFVAGPDIPRAAEEVTRAASRWKDASVLTGDDATTSHASGLATAVDVLHLTGHGRHATDNPYFSGIELIDGPWFGYDVEQLPATPSLVVLSACELGRSSVSWGHEALGMAQTWLRAGARCVIASPVNVNDDVACELLPVMHGLLAGGTAPAEALASASRETGLSSPFMSYGSGW